MHTVFINTTNHPVGDRIDVLKYEKKFKKLLYVKCPLTVWNDEYKGFKGALKTIAEYIDTYNDVDNDFNLIVYADLIEISEYMQLSLSDAEPVAQQAIYDTYRDMVLRLFASTIVRELNEAGRSPADKMLLLLEQPQIKQVGYGKEMHGAELSQYEKARLDAVLSLLSILPMEELEKRLANPEGDQSGEAISLCDKRSNRKTDKGFRFFDLYQDKIQIMIDEIGKDNVPITKACLNLSNGVSASYVSDSKTVLISEFYTDRISTNISLEASVKRNILMQCFILNCVYDQSIYKKQDGETVPQRVPQLSEEKWDEVVAAWVQKKKAYACEERRIARLADGFVEIGLAPRLRQIAREKFGLDRSGNISNEYVLQDPSQDSKKSQNKDRRKDSGSPSNKGKAIIKTELTEKTGVVQNWFTNDEYRLYDSDGDECISQIHGLLSADEYCGRATELTNHHLQIIDKLNIHVKRIMSNYSGRSISNKPAILRKRSVNAGERVSQSIKNDYQYAAKNGEEYVEETQPSETVIETSKRSYVTILLEYLKFNAGRGVAVADIKEQCEWLIDHIRRIEESLKKLRWIFVVLAIFIGVLYVPFVMIQWNDIVLNPGTLLVALASMAVPYVLLPLIYQIAKVLQKRKMKKVWEEFVERSKEATASNKKAIAAYDELLTKYIPALRWVYEYVLDVDFHRDCCRVARTKLNHHREKLFEMKEIIGNILEDLDVPKSDDVVQDHDYQINYTRAFCEEENYDFYSIIDQKIRDIIYEREETLE